MHLAPGKELIKIAAGVGPGQRVYESAALHSVAAVQQQTVAAHIQPAAIRQPGDQFQHTAPAAYLDILGNDKIGFLVLELDLIQDGLAGVGFGGDAVFAPGIPVPYHVAVAGLFGQDAVTVQRKHLAVPRVYQTHHIKDALQPPQEMGGILLRVGRGQQLGLMLHAVLLIGQLPQHVHAAAHPGTAPDGMQRHPVQPRFPVPLHHDRQHHVRRFRRGAADGLGKLAPILLVQKAEPLALRKIGYLFLLHGLGMVIIHGHAASQQVVVEPDAAALGGVEIRALLFLLQQQLGVVLPGQRLPVQNLLGKAVGLLPEAPVPLRAGQLGAQLLRGLSQAVQQQRVEGTALAVQYHAQRGVVIVGVLIAALAGQSVVYVCQCHHLRRNWDLIPFQPVGVAIAVPALVVPAADGVRHLQKRLVLRNRLSQILQHLCARHGMVLDNGKLLGSQTAGLVQDFLRNDDLADIVQRRGGADACDIAFIQLVAVGLLHQPVQKQVGQGADVHNMKPALAVAELHHMAQDADHQHAVVLFFVHLIGDKAGEPLLLGVQHEDILHPAQHHDPLEGTADIIRYTQIVGTLYVGSILCRRDDDDRDLVQPCVVLHHPQHVKAVHARHHQIQQKQGDIRALPHQFHRCCTILCFQIVIAIAQYLLEQGTVDLGIIRDQDLRFLVHGHVSPFAAHPSAPALFRVYRPH